MKKTKKLKKIKKSDKITKSVKNNLLTHIEKRLDTAQQSNLSMGDLIKIMQESKDVKDKVLGDMVNKLFDKESLLSISILDTDMMYHVLRHLLVLNYYVERWNKLTVDVVLIPNPTVYPYYIIETKYNGDMSKKEAESYNRFIRELLEIRISLKGQGREDVKDIVRGAEQRILQSDMLQRGKDALMSKFS